jgi:hypothetical protein
LLHQHFQLVKLGVAGCFKTMVISIKLDWGVI